MSMKKQNFIEIFNRIKKRYARIAYLFLAEKMGFEPMCPKPDNRISSAARYDHFDTFPSVTHILYTNSFIIANKIVCQNFFIDFFFA